MGWMNAGAAAAHCFTSMNASLTPVNDFQREGLAQLGVVRRDPMFVTMLSCLDVERFPTEESMRQHCNSLGSAEEQQEAVMWLRDGMSPAEVQEVFALRLGAPRS